MAKFSSQEVEALQKGGNQRARDIFLKDWDMQRMRLPDNSNVDRIREFIKNVYVDKKYAGGRTSDKPPRDMQSSKTYEEDHRRASSYHSYSQSPPYEYQYEDRRYGKQTGMLSRKPGSDRGLEGKISSFVYSPGRARDQMYEDRFANESSSRMSDYSVSSTVDPFRSPNSQREIGYNSPPLHSVREILVDDVKHQASNTHADGKSRRDTDGFAHRQRTASSGSFGSLDSNSASLQSFNSGSQDLFGPPFIQPSATSSIQSVDLFADFNNQPSSATIIEQKSSAAPPVIQPSATSSIQSVDLFADVTNQPSPATIIEQKSSAPPPSENQGWATFDMPHHAAPTSDLNSVILASGVAIPKGSIDGFHAMDNSVQDSSLQNSTAHVPLTSMSGDWTLDKHVVQASTSPDSSILQNSTVQLPSVSNDWSLDKNVVQASTAPVNSQSWNAFDDFIASFPQLSFDSAPQKIEPQVQVHNPPIVAPHSGSDFGKDGMQRSIADVKAPVSNLLFDNNAMGSSFLPPVVPSAGGTQSYNLERKSTNPFDFSDDAALEPSNVQFLDMSSLQSTLPDPQFPSTFLGGVSHSWFPQNPAAPYVPTVPQGSLSFMAATAPVTQLPNVSSQGPVAPLGGNPFA
ncbi:putative ADP-ribosylation factor GTPase-activating protein AGD14 [Acorus calamus]|uniref:ADP-ribosylation factor GTPase-activating protein AGD14 n=1 Tax=Acorus calamus TaxID=4465 RepID=A0AAV9D2B5_ACOCL|nr:putative ADP-ribosylation factor GTPase-activating protein AGD14 [Acorus calamus]